jgi:ATP-dependent helicase HrpA
MRFRVIDAESKIVGASRDLAALQRTFALRARESFAQLAKGPFERDRVTQWDFGDLPERVAISHGEFLLSGYPALSAEGDGVALRVFQRPAIAATAHRAGLRRLFAIRLAETVKHVRRSLPGMQALALKLTFLGSADALRDDIIAAAIDRVCIDDDHPSRTKEAFERRAELGRGKLAGAAEEIASRVGAVLTAYQAAVRFIPDVTAAGSPWPEIRDHLGRLVYSGFVSRTPAARFSDLERYLKAVALRVERIRHNPAKDRERTAQIAPLWQKYVALADATRGTGAEVEELERYRWLLEEWRVSLFAQELRTAEPVSEKKLAEQWSRVTNVGARLP